jgi:transcriptional regulator of acetoin/glycerol metabolism
VLIDYGLSKFNSEKRRRTLLSADAREALLQYEWHGNVRELLNTIESLVVLVGDGTVKPEHLPDRMLHGRTDPMTLRSEIRSRERELLIAALERNSWNATRAAQELDITREALQRKMKQLDIVRPKS